MKRGHIKNIFLGIIIFFLILSVLWLATLYAERRWEKQLPRPEEQRKNDSAPGLKQPLILPNISPGSKNTILPDDAASRIPVIRYQSGVFLPEKIIAKEAGSGVGCFLTIANQSSAPLVVRLGPHEKGRERGVPYPAIPPGQSAIIDPRYTGIVHALFYNAARPDEQFSVEIGAGCQ